MWNVPLPNMAGFVLIGWLWIMAVADVFALREKKRVLVTAREDFDRQFEASFDAMSPTGCVINGTGKLHPSAVVLQSIIREPVLAQDEMALSTWIASAIHDAIGSLRSRMELIHGIAPTMGLLGTIMGLAIGTWTYSQTHNQALLLSSVAFALTKTLLAGIVALIEEWQLNGLESMETELVLHAQTTAARARIQPNPPNPEPAGGLCANALSSDPANGPLRCGAPR